MNHWEGDTFFVQTYRQHQGQEPMVISGHISNGPQTTV